MNQHETAEKQQREQWYGDNINGRKRRSTREDRGWVNGGECMHIRVGEGNHARVGRALEREGGRGRGKAKREGMDE